MAVHVPQDVTTHLMNHLSLHPTLRTCSSDTILRAIKELTQESISYTSDMGKTYDFNTADTLNTLLLNCIFASDQLKEGEMYDVDFDHQFIETEKYDAKSTYKKFLGYRPGVAVIGDLIVGIIRNFYKAIIQRLDVKKFGLNATSRIKAFVFRFISVPAKWIRTSRRYVLNIYTYNNAYADVFQTDFGNAYNLWE